MPTTTGSDAAKTGHFPNAGPFVLNSDPELLAKYVSRVGDGAWLLQSSADNAQEIDDLAAAISGLLTDALQASGCPRKGSKGGASGGIRSVIRGARSTVSSEDTLQHQRISRRPKSSSKLLSEGRKETSGGTLSVVQPLIKTSSGS